MAKSLRSKPKLRAKSIKRKAEFANFVNDRDLRLAEKIQANLEKQKAKKEQEKAESSQDKPAEEQKYQPIDFKSISTAGGKRNSKGERKKGKKGKKSKFLNY